MSPRYGHSIATDCIFGGENLKELVRVLEMRYIEL